MIKNAVAILIEDKIYHYMLTEGIKLTIGSSTQDTICSHEMGDAQIIIECKNGVIQMKSKGDNSAPVIISKEVLNILHDSPKIIIYVDNEENDQTIKIDIPENKWITIGRNADNDIQVKSSFISRKHMKIMRKDNQLFFIDSDSKNGVYFKGALSEDGAINNGQNLFVLTMGLVFQNGSIFLSGTNKNLVSFDQSSLYEMVEDSEFLSTGQDLEEENLYLEESLEEDLEIPVEPVVKTVEDEEQPYITEEIVEEQTEEKVEEKAEEPFYYGSDTVVFGVASALNDVGKTSITLALCELLAEQYRVLYINAEAFQTFSFYLDRPLYLMDRWMDDWSPDMPTETLAEKLEIAVDQYNGIDYLKPFANPRTAMATTVDYYKSVIRAFRKEYEYDYIFVDMGDMWKDDSQDLLKCFDYTIMVSSYSRKSVYATNVYYQIHKQDAQDSIIFIQNNCNNLSEMRQTEMKRSIKYPVSLDIPFDESVDETIIGDKTAITVLKEIVESKK